MVETRSTLLKRLHDSSDEASWEEFVTLYEPLLWRYIHSRGLSESDAKDVAQNIFSSLVTVLADFELDRTRGRFRTWLWRVTQNAIADWARRQNRQKRAEEEWRRRLTTIHSHPEPDWDTAYRHRVLEFSLGQVRNKTRPKTWRCFEKHVLQRQPAAEVAAELETNTNAVYANASRVLARVRCQCAEYMEEFEDLASP